MEFEDYNNQNPTSGVWLNQVSEQERATFIKNTYLHVAGALLSFVIVEYILFQIPGMLNLALSMLSGSTWLIVLVLFMLGSNVAVRMTNNATSIGMQYAGLGIYVLLEAVIFVPLILIAMLKTGGLDVVYSSAILTGGLFAGLTLIALTSKSDFSWMRSILSIGGMIMLALILVFIFVGGSMFGLLISFAMVALMAGSILYQTSQLKHTYRTDQHVAASLGLFAAFMTMLWYIIQIFLRSE